MTPAVSIRFTRGETVMDRPGDIKTCIHPIVSDLICPNCWKEREGGVEDSEAGVLC